MSGAEIVFFDGGSFMEGVNLLPIHPQKPLGGPPVDVGAAEPQSHPYPFTWYFSAFGQQTYGVLFQVKIRCDFLKGEHTVGHKMEPKAGIEPATYSLRVNCSTN